MEAARGSWADVEVRSYIQDKNGKSWRVERLSIDRARLVDRAGKEVDIARPPGEREVTILTPSEGDAKHTLAKALGARILASRDEDRVYRCPPPSSWDLAGARWHMERFHRIHFDDSATLDSIRQHHLTDDPPIPHIHTEDL